MRRPKDDRPAAPEAPTRAGLRERRRVADAVAALLESPETPRELSDLVADHVIRISEETHLYIFAPEVVRAVYPLMCERAAALEAERARERRRARRTPRASKPKGEQPTAETDSVN